MSGSNAGSGHVHTVMQEERVFPPPGDFSSKARIGSLDEYQRLYDEARNDPDGFWDARARELPWTTPYTQVLDWQPPVARWFVDGKINASAACVDHQVARGHGEKPAIVWVGEPEGESADTDVA